MRLFDPKYIHCRWDESLRGKEVLYSDTVIELENEVRDMATNTIGVVTGPNDDDDMPFKVKGAILPFSYWRYVYYDPNYNTKIAYYRDGKQVQNKYYIDDDWKDCCAEPCWCDSYDYRVKPDEQYSEKHVVPATEFPSLCGYCIHRKDGCTPEPAGNCINFLSTNEDYFRVKKDYDALVKEHVELERKYGDLVSGIQQLMHKPVNC